jgi:hypothetical protein
LDAESVVPVVVERFGPAGVLGVAAIVVIVGLQPKPRRSASIYPCSQRKYARKRQYRPRRSTEKNLGRRAK